MKISNQIPTSHIFTYLMDYHLDHESNRTSEYGFGYFELDIYSINSLNKFLDNKEKGKRDYEGIILPIGELFLIKTEWFNNLISKIDITTKIDDEIRGIKLDSINFLESKPNLEYPTMIKGKGNVLADHKGFIIECEDIVDRGTSMSIYRSEVNSYWKINHLLQRSKPI